MEESNTESKLSDRSKPYVPTRADIEHMINDWIDAVRRDWGKNVDDRLKQVLIAHMTTLAIDVRDAVLAQKSYLLKKAIDDMDHQLHL